MASMLAKQGTMYHYIQVIQLVINQSSVLPSIDSIGFFHVVKLQDIL